MRSPITYLVLLLIFSSVELIGQTAKFANGPQITGMVQLGIPQNEFAEAFRGNPSGFGGSILFPVGKLKLLHFGGEYAWNSMGKEKLLVEIENGAEEVLGGEMTVRSRTRTYHAVMRFSPLSGPVRLYFDVFFGMRVYNTNTEVLVEETDGTEISTTQDLSNESTNSYGFAGGVMLALSRNFFIDAKLQSLRGGEVRYVDQNTLGITSEGEVDFELQNTATDMLVPQIGLSIVF